MKAGSKGRMEGIVRQWFSEHYPRSVTARLLHLKVRVKLEITEEDDFDMLRKGASHYVWFEVWYKDDCIMQGVIHVARTMALGRDNTDGVLPKDEFVWRADKKMELHPEFCIK